MDDINIPGEKGTISFGMEHRERGNNQPGRQGNKAYEVQWDVMESGGPKWFYTNQQT